MLNDWQELEDQQHNILFIEYTYSYSSTVISKQETVILKCEFSNLNIIKNKLHNKTNFDFVSYTSIL